MSTVYKYCFISYQGYSPCNCLVETPRGFDYPCRAGLRIVNGKLERLIYDIVLSRPEDYLSIYQSCCNHNCLKCHSWYFTQITRGSWYSIDKLLSEVEKYVEEITIWEPRDRSTMWHASDLCSHCGLCLLISSRGLFCPGKLSKEQIKFSPQGYGPARNIVSFTGGDLYCQPAYYIEFFKHVKKEYSNIWIHIETNGYGLTNKNLELLYSAGLDSIWLDMKAYSRDIYEYLCGTGNEHILELPGEIIDNNIVLEIVLLYIPGLVEIDEIRKLGEKIASFSRDIPIMLLAFFPEYKMINYRSPQFTEIVEAYRVLREVGNRRVKIGNIGVFCKTVDCVNKLIREIGREAVAL